MQGRNETGRGPETRYSGSVVPDETGTTNFDVTGGVGVVRSQTEPSTNISGGVDFWEGQRSSCDCLKVVYDP